jgi:hypothetical protein
MQNDIVGCKKKRDRRLHALNRFGLKSKIDVQLGRGLIPVRVKNFREYGSNVLWMRYLAAQ